MSPRAGWKRLFRLEESSQQIERNIDEELQFHIEYRVEQFMATGMREQEARSEAEREFGGLENARTELEIIETRRLRKRALSESIAGGLRNVRQAARSYVRRPGFALTALIIMALGIGATTTIFSVVDGVLLKRLPYPDTNRLVYFDRAAHTVPRYRDWKAWSTSFSSMAASSEIDLDYTGSDNPERLSGVMVTPEYLPLLGATTMVGRMFVPDDFSGIPDAAVLGYGAWQRLFGGDPAIIGRTIVLNELPGTVVGVLDPDFVSPAGLIGSEPDIWIPLDITRPDMQNPDYYILEVIARRRDGVSIASAQAEMSLLAETLTEQNPEVHARDDGSPRPVPIVSLHSALTGSISDTLVFILAAVGLLLAIACANLANLFLARATDRVHEVGVRYALGASRHRIIGQLLIESALLSTAGGILGAMLAYLGVKAFIVLNPGGIPMIDRIGVDLRALSFALVASLLTGILFGLAPAWRASRLNLNAALKVSTPGMTGGRHRARLRNSLLVAEMALALTLLVVAGLLLNSFIRLRSVDPGFDPDGLIALSLQMESSRFTEEQRQLFATNLLERVTHLPGVRRAVSTGVPPFFVTGSRRYGSFSSDFQADDGHEIDLFTSLQPIGSDYFTVLGASLRGRQFTAEDHLEDPLPAVISDEFARQLFRGEESLGRTFTTRDQSYRVVGTVAGVHHWGLDQGSSPQVYYPWDAQGGDFRRITLLIRTDIDAIEMIPAIRSAVWELEPDLPIWRLSTMTDRINQSLTAPRFYSALFLTFAVVAILLAAGGIYGSMLYSVGQRRRELGIRSVLGANQGRLAGMVVRQGAILALIGIGIGSAGALAFARALESAVFGITTTDLPTYLAVSALLGVVAVAASLIPALRAARANPVEALRTE